MTDGEIDLRTCRLPGCDGPRSGVCINNLAFDECPDVVAADDGGGKGPPPSAAGISENTVSLPGGHSLDVAACDALLRQRGGTAVGLVAGIDVGKTTLAGTMYELLRLRRMKSHGFAGSETLRGYEERCHLARTASENTEADTKRTRRAAHLSFTHLRVATGDARRDLIFSDRSGEHYDEALAHPAEFARFGELRRSDVTLLLVDLVLLMKNPHSLISKTRRLFAALDQNDMISGKRILLVGTKTDQAAPSPRSRKAAKALSELATDLMGRSRTPCDMKAMMVACRARPGTTDVGEGVEELLDEILRPMPPKAIAMDDSWPSSPNELDNLMLAFRARRS